MLKMGSLFSGCGGLDLGLEAALSPYAKTIWQVERDPFCQKVLKQNFGVPVYENVKTVGSDILAPIDILHGGFPCQDISAANNKGRGLEGDRSGLWWEMQRIIREMAPRTLVIENVPALAGRGLDQVLGSLMALGGLYRYIEWDCISALAVGARHRRDRLFIVCHNGPHPLCERLEGWKLSIREKAQHAFISNPRWWEVERGMDRSFDGLPSGIHRARNQPDRKDRIKALGNAVVPQVGFRVGLYLREILSLPD